MLGGDWCFGKKQDKQVSSEWLRRRYNLITHCERIERWKMWKESQETCRIEPSINCFQNNSQENKH